VELVFTSAKKKSKFNVLGNNTTLAEFLVFEILGYLLRFFYFKNKKSVLTVAQFDAMSSVVVLFGVW